MDKTSLINYIKNKIKEKLQLKAKAPVDKPARSRVTVELLGADQMERYAVTLAFSHELTKKSAPNMLLGQLKESEATLVESCTILTKKEFASAGFSPSREWLLDNFYLIQEQIYTIRRNLPKGYGRSLPQLANGIRGYPRIYDIALQIIEHGDGLWDLETLSRFVAAYQTITNLTLGELWAIPITLGVALIENLSKVSKHIVADLKDRQLANHWADRMMDVAVSDPKKLVIVIADMARSEPTMTSAFVAELSRRLQGAALALPLSWIEQHLTEEGLTIEQLVHEDNRDQAAHQITVSNSITGLRNLSEVHWQNFVETMSVVEKVLQTDPSTTYGKMDFGTRDRYRHEVERLSRACLLSEKEVAEASIQLAKQTMDSFVEQGVNVSPDILRYAHVGYYLIDKGLPQLEKKLQFHRSLWLQLCYLAERWALQCYLGSILLITAGIAYVLILKASLDQMTPGWLISLGVVIVVCGSQLAVSLVNLSVTLLVSPKPLPKMDFSKGLPASFRTLVAVPALLTTKAEAQSLIEALEVRFLGNRDPNLHFALLTDFVDAKKQKLPEDNDLLDLAVKLISELNKQYSNVPHEDIFFLFHRNREWNDSEKLWMGKERKRGKLTELNNLLSGNNQPDFSMIVGRTDTLKSVKYIITLDSDTELPRESAREFVGTMVHPLNRPVLDVNKQRVVDGYGILQPRISEALPNVGPTAFVKLWGGEFGIDPYTRTVSDVYQDLFQEGSFIGKGIYEVSLFQQVLGQRFPDNRILSHDLLEGCFLRSGLISDLPLYESYPSSYLADAKRRMRWIRGDWQLIGWLLPWVANKAGKYVRNTLSFLSKFKLFDNLRRSLVPIALMVLLAFNWTILPPMNFWLGIILIIVILPGVVNILLELLRKPNDTLAVQHIDNVIYVIRKRILHLLFYLSILPHEAWYSANAILRTLWRLLVSKRHLLEWTASQQVDRHRYGKVTEWLISLWIGPAAAIAAFVALVMEQRWGPLLLSSPLLILWALSPIITYWLSQPPKDIVSELTPFQVHFLRKVARRTWAYFEKFMREEDHWLPPDNYQEEPIESLARRTSPTNIGLSLLSNLTAYDFGYINLQQLLVRTENTLNTINALEKYQGHLFNWYNTETLHPLFPRYVSSVDSGNLAGHLLTLRQGLLALPNDPLLNPRLLDGMADTYDLLLETYVKPTKELSRFQVLLKEGRASFTSWSRAADFANKLYEAAEHISIVSKKLDNAFSRKYEWANKLYEQGLALKEEIGLYSNIQNFSENVTLREVSAMPINNASGEFEQSLIEKAQATLAHIDTLAALTFSLTKMDISFLYDESSHLMTIGFNVDLKRRDPSNYDLLSSEARLGTFVAIAQGQVLQESWFALGRLLASSGGEPILISWSGSMFEYLMPLIVMPNYPGTLLDQTCRAAVNRQITYGKLRGVPWGVSESGYNAVDTHLNYLYRAFGVPGLGLKRGLEDDLVIAPYATAMALMVTPKVACLNLERLAAESALGKYGFYEAIDFTKSRLPGDSTRAIVRSFMTHHQGMSFLSYSYCLHYQPMQRRFNADPLFQATLLLLQERVPKPTASYLKIPKAQPISETESRPQASVRTFSNPNTRLPQVHLLSNGHYHLMLTHTGGGYSRWKDIAVTRWREDTTSDNWGMFGYLRDVDAGAFWSTIYQPIPGETENYKAIFTEAHVEYSRTDHALFTHTEVVVSPEDDIELRRIRIHNHSKLRRTIEFTSYAEVVLVPQAADLAQPAFSNLFVETELLQEHQAVLALRRSQNTGESTPCLFHLLNVQSEKPYSLSYETDRARFIGRARTLIDPLAMVEAGDLSNTQGPVLDPIVAIRCRLVLEPDALVILDLLTGITDTREHCVALVEKYKDFRLSNRIFELAWTHGQVLLHQLNISETDAQHYAKLAGYIIYSNNKYRTDQLPIINNRRGQSGLWSYSISGDLPIVLLYIEEDEGIEMVRQLIQAQIYWRRKGLLVDIVILNKESVSYRQSLQDQLMSLITNTGTSLSDHTGTIVLRTVEQLPPEDLILFEAVARVILSDKNGSLGEQLDRRRTKLPQMPALTPNKTIPRYVANKLSPLPENLHFFNGLGGFTPRGDEYIIQLAEGMTTPAPWVNVIANPKFGSLVSESGQGYTWTENAHELRLTPWDNDPVRDSSGEAFYLRDDDTGLAWSPTLLPRRGEGDYRIRHGFGYSVFEHVEDGIYSEFWIYVAMDMSVKFFVLKLRNDTGRNRRISAFGFMSWVLGNLPAKQSMHIVTELSDSRVLLAQNHYNTEFGDRTAFFDASALNFPLNARSVTCDRAEFIGRNGSLADPAGLNCTRLSGRVGAGLDPCGTIQLSFDLTKNQTREIVFTLGIGNNKQEAETLAQKCRNGLTAKETLSEVRLYWEKMLSGLQVKTPDTALNLLANGWLLYQLLSSRLWGRSGYYQSGGAFGFRDQLQDVMALTHVAPQLLRAHILLCAAHQFEAGDVQHWWHPPQNRGVRTRCSDDYLWLPYVICDYVEKTGDVGVLDEKIPFLQGRPLNPDEESYYELPTIGTQAIPLYQHAVRAILHGLKFGTHGLPLMGSGDWNDGMNLVGSAGRGESVWLGFFLYDVLKRFSALALARGDNEVAGLCNSESEKLQDNIEKRGWDGDWYRRAYFDDGTPLGSVNDTECRIDAIAQSWAVLSKAADPMRAKQAMAAVQNNLVNAQDGLIKLLDPPFNKSIPSPGYIQGYLPGIRENGGQYTHAAVWTVKAFAELNEKALAWELVDMINPIHHGRTPGEIARYKIEPYVVSSDIYSVPPHAGRGGWSWYTGSAGWLYRLITETLLGIQLIEGKRLRLCPMLPDSWDSFSLEYRYGTSIYKITIYCVQGESSLLLDGVQIAEGEVALQDDGKVHQIQYRMVNKP